MGSEEPLGEFVSLAEAVVLIGHFVAPAPETAPTVNRSVFKDSVGSFQLGVSVDGGHWVAVGQDREEDVDHLLLGLEHVSADQALGDDVEEC